MNQRRGLLENIRRKKPGTPQIVRRAHPAAATLILTAELQLSTATSSLSVFFFVVIVALALFRCYDPSNGSICNTPCCYKLRAYPLLLRKPVRT